MNRWGRIEHSTLASGDRPHELDGRDAVGAGLAFRGRRRSCVDDQEIFVHAQDQRRAGGGACVQDLRVATSKSLQIAWERYRPRTPPRMVC
ncbi:hypothetical protein RZS08_10490 [Arthrospira platensis SPKY1]|nr:hypothetical protein [Arthrospira platensis SPKY1]